MGVERIVVGPPVFLDEQLGRIVDAGYAALDVVDMIGWNWGEKRLIGPGVLVIANDALGT